MMYDPKGNGLKPLANFLPTQPLIAAFVIEIKFKLFFSRKTFLCIRVTAQLLSDWCQWHLGSVTAKLARIEGGTLARLHITTTGEVKVCVCPHPPLAPGAFLCSVHYCLDLCSICQFSGSLKLFPAFEGWGSLQGPSSSTHPRMTFRPKSTSLHKLFSRTYQTLFNKPNRKLIQQLNAGQIYGLAHNLHMKQWNATNNKEEMCECVTKVHLAYGTVREKQQLLPWNPLKWKHCSHQRWQLRSNKPAVMYRIRDQMVINEPIFTGNTIDK